MPLTPDEKKKQEKQTLSHLDEQRPARSYLDKKRIEKVEKYTSVMRFHAKKLSEYADPSLDDLLAEITAVLESTDDYLKREHYANQQAALRGLLGLENKVNDLEDEFVPASDTQAQDLWDRFEEDDAEDVNSPKYQLLAIKDSLEVILREFAEMLKPLEELTEWPSYGLPVSYLNPPISSASQTAQLKPSLHKEDGTMPAKVLPRQRNTHRPQRAALRKLPALPPPARADFFGSQPTLAFGNNAVPPPKACSKSNVACVRRPLHPLRPLAKADFFGSQPTLASAGGAMLSPAVSPNQTVHQPRRACRQPDSPLPAEASLAFHELASAFPDRAKLPPKACSKSNVACVRRPLHPLRPLAKADFFGSQPTLASAGGAMLSPAVSPNQTVHQPRRACRQPDSPLPAEASLAFHELASAFPDRAKLLPKACSKSNVACVRRPLPPLPPLAGAGFFGSQPTLASVGGTMLSPAVSPNQTVHQPRRACRQPNSSTLARTRTGFSESQPALASFSSNPITQSHRPSPKP